MELLWSLWTEPEHFATWYGPAGAGVTVVRMDMRVGGPRLVGLELQTPNGPMRMWFTGEYVEVAANRRLSYTESVADEHGAVLAPEAAGLPPGHPVTTRVTVTFDDLGGCTRTVLTHAGVPGDSPGAVGWTMALDTLAAEVTRRTRPGATSAG